MSAPRKPTRQGSKSCLERGLDLTQQPPPQVPITVYQGPKPISGLLHEDDLEIARRLENLRSTDEVLPSSDEVGARLARLKGIDPKYYTGPAPPLPRPDTRTMYEQADDLMSQYTEQVNLEARLPKPEDELEARLAKLRGQEVPSRQAEGGQIGNLATHGGAAMLGAPSKDEIAGMSLSDVDKLMQQTERELKAEADGSLAQLRSDPNIKMALYKAAKKNKKKKRDEEKYSDSSDREDELSALATASQVAAGATAEQVAEVQRVIDMFTEHAKEKAEKKRLKRLKKEQLGDAYVSDGDDSSYDEISSIATSESEKLSDSD